jgi:hypothetical protein
MSFTRLLTPLACALLALAAAAPVLQAAPVFLQDYEAPGNLDPPFNLQPHFSGTTDGVVAVNPGASTITHVAADGANATAASAELFIPFDPATSPGGGGWAWQVRFIPNNGANNNAANPLFTADGYVGYWLKVDSAVTAEMQTAPALEGSTGTGTATTGDLKPIIKDGQWHLYQWNMDDPAQFDNAWTSVFGGGLGDTTLEASVSFDAIAIVSTNGVNANVRIDQIGYDNAGPLVPEPAALALAAMSVAAIGCLRRRTVA